MNPKLLSVLRCPICLERLSLKSDKLKGLEIISGKLLCNCGKIYPIFNGVPIMLLNLPKGLKKIQKSFSKEWKKHKYGQTKTWRLKSIQRKNLFLSQMRINNINSLKHKKLLDAGCGNGELTVLLSDYGLETIGLDLSNSVFLAYKNNPKKNKTFFVQGDVMNPPFNKETFDYIYSDGVFHHTPDTKYSFSKIADLTKKKGKFWAWIYLKRKYVKDNKFKLYLYDLIRFFLSRCSSFIQDFIIYTFALPLANLLLFFNILKHKDSQREMEILIRDAFTPYYDFKHTPAEVKSWFEEKDFKNITLSDTRQLYGFGIYGIKK